MPIEIDLLEIFTFHGHANWPSWSRVSRVILLKDFFERNDLVKFILMRRIIFVIYSVTRNPREATFKWKNISLREQLSFSFEFTRGA